MPCSPASTMLSISRKLASIGPPGNRLSAPRSTGRIDLLTADQQAFFRHLGIFAGGADLDAVTAVTADAYSGSDPFDMLMGLVEASLITIGETADGEPRIALLESVRAYARDQLPRIASSPARAEPMLSTISTSPTLEPSLFGDQRQTARTRFEAEHDNLRAALGWALPPTEDRARAQMAAHTTWHQTVRKHRILAVDGYSAEGRHG